MLDRNIAAVDDLIAKGDLHVIRNNKPQYVVLSEERYQELMAAEQEAHYASVRESLQELKEGRENRGAADDLIKELKLGELDKCAKNIKILSLMTTKKQITKTFMRR
jgi:PHD/YefM family antitoxin component YafN of YafNO toxin-antitoxin module